MIKRINDYGLRFLTLFHVIAFFAHHLLRIKTRKYRNCFKIQLHLYANSQQVFCSLDISGQINCLFSHTYKVHNAFH